MGKKLKERFNFHKPTKEEVKKTLINSLLVILGTFILTVGTELFILPAGLDTGGVSGIAVCFQYANLSISSETLITIITWSLFFIGLIFLGWQFSAQTLLSTICYTLFLYLVQHLMKVVPWLNIENSASLILNFTARDGSTTYTAINEGLLQLLCAVFGGVCTGAGCAVTFLGGGSTGGVDIITFILCKFIKSIKSSYSIFAIDAIIVFAGFVSNPAHDLALCLEGVLSAFIASLVIDKVFQGTSKTYVAYIVTEAYEEITQDVIKKLDRTTSIVDIQGGYTKTAKKMVMVSFTMRQYNELRLIVAERDKKAFMTINQAHEINGEGFNPIGK